MAENTRKIEWEVDFNTGKATQNINRMNREFEKTVQESSRLTGSLRTTEERLETGGRKWGEMAGAVGNVTGVIAQANPAMAQTASLLGGIGSAASAASGAFGPLGVALAAVSAAYGIFEIATQQATDASEQAAEIAAVHARRMRELADSYRNTAGAVRQAREALAGQVAGSRESLQAQEDLIEGIETQLERTRRLRARNSGIANAQLDEQITRMEGDLQIAQFRLEQIRAASEFNEAGAQSQQQTTDEFDAEARRRSSGASAAERRRREAEEEARQQRLRAKEAENNAILAMEREQEEAQQLRVNAMIENEERLALERARIRAEDQEAMQQQLQDEIALVQRREQEMQESYERITNESLPIIQEAIGGITEALSATIAGAKSADQAFQGLLAGFLELIAQQTALQAAKEFAEAIAAFASQRYDQGALHLAAGAAFTAVAVAAGAASIAVAPPAEAAPASPQAGGSGGSGGGGNSYTINVSGPVISSGSRAQAGRELSSLIGEGDRRFARAS